MELLKSVLREISDGKRDYAPSGESPREVKDFQPIAKCLVYANENNLLKGMVTQESMRHSDYGSYIRVLLKGGLTLEGDRYLEGESGDLLVKSMTNNHYTFNNSQGIQIGDGNSQQLQITLQQLVKEIDSSSGSEEQKKEAKNLLSKFLEHPLVVAVVGAAASSPIY